VSVPTHAPHSSASSRLSRESRYSAAGPRSFAYTRVDFLHPVDAQKLHQHQLCGVNFVMTPALLSVPLLVAPRRCIAVRNCQPDFANWRRHCVTTTGWRPSRGVGLADAVGVHEVPPRGIFGKPCHRGRVLRAEEHPPVELRARLPLESPHQARSAHLGADDAGPRAGVVPPGTCRPCLLQGHTKCSCMVQVVALQKYKAHQQQC
jgi:hypothetical protein